MVKFRFISIYSAYISSCIKIVNLWGYKYIITECKKKYESVT